MCGLRWGLPSSSETHRGGTVCLIASEMAYRQSFIVALKNVLLQRWQISVTKDLIKVSLTEINVVFSGIYVNSYVKKYSMCCYFDIVLILYVLCVV